MKFLVYQILGLGVIWIGMAFFFQEMDQFSKLIFYAATSWLLFLIVILIKQLIKNHKNDDDSTLGR
ncbi:hypothetical protein AOX59_10540 [Lentibacillus amyloliquefaciens]|uniref:Uncharacterized protein n=1 Tax=Lentibacillus amyloliquefaciens TaxID=1472767 RepID=A0A0U4FMN4_9BACI|nr:hypothetical protein AOX59_10540 [Lentibacillus amyloliquefaciens]